MCWQQVGYMMIIYIAGLQSVSEDMLEAAQYRRRERLADPVEDHHSHRHALHHHLHLPDADQLL